MLGAVFALVFSACAPESDPASGSEPAAFSEPGSANAEVFDDSSRSPELEFGLGDTFPSAPIVPDAADPSVPIADSVSQFTSVQGMHGWYYGYLEPDNANIFTEAQVYVSGGADPGWYALPDARTWTFMDATTMHPNGESTTEGRAPLEQWAARRWVSNVEGNVRIAGDLAKYYADGNSSGVAGYVFVDGVMVWAWYLEGWDEAGISFDKVVPVLIGSTVDFVLDPWESDDRSDRSMFTSQIYLSE